jgi:hypothetical protein
MKIFVESYYKGLFLLLPNGFAVKILERNGTKTFGKLTLSVRYDKIYNKETLPKKFKVSKEYLEYFEKNYNKFRIIWNVDAYGHKIGEPYIYDNSKPGYPWNLVCHHIGYYRRYGRRAEEDAWKLAVAGLNPQIFKSL